MSSPEPDPLAEASEPSQGTFSAALSCDKDPKKVFAKQLALDEREIPEALAITLSHIWLKMGGKPVCESTEIEVDDGLTFGLLSGNFFKAHCCSLFRVDPNNFGRNLSLVLTGHIIDDNIFQDEIFGPNFDLIAAIRKASSSILTSFTLFHVYQNDVITRVENHFVEEPLNFVLLAIHGREVFDVQVLFIHHLFFLPNYQFRPQHFPHKSRPASQFTTAQNSSHPNPAQTPELNNNNAGRPASPNPATAPQSV